MTTKEREEVISILSAEGVPLDVTRALLRAGSTLHRLAEAECNGDDWRNERGPRHYAPKPADKTLCGESTADDAVRLTGTWPMVTCSSCKSARVEERVRKVAEAHGLTPIFQGDPRGAVLIVTVPSGRTNDWGKRGIVVG